VDWKEGLLYPYALREGGEVAEARTAVRGERHCCVGCGGDMVLRRGEYVRAHFAHFREAEGCGGETLLHKMAKVAIKHGIESAIKEGRTYGFSWTCSVCGMEHCGDLAVNERELRVEAELDGVRPDLLALSMQGKPLVVVEVIVSHSPDPETVEAYKARRIPVILVRVGWDGLEGLSKELGRRKVFNAACRARRCPKCKGIVLHNKVGSVCGYKCWKCGKGMRVIWKEGLVPYARCDLPKSLIGPAAVVGVELKWLRSRAGGYWTVYHICPDCGARQAEFGVYERAEPPLWIEWPEPDRTVEFYYCEACDVWLKKERAA